MESSEEEEEEGAGAMAMGAPGELPPSSSSEEELSDEESEVSLRGIEITHVLTRGTRSRPNNGSRKEWMVLLKSKTQTDWQKNQ